MPVKTLHKTTPSIWLPGSPHIKTKIVITDDSGVDYTVMDSYSGSSTSNYTIDAEVTRTVTDSLGNFKIRLVNDSGRFYKTFNGGELVKIYSDATDATTLIFVGKIDNVKYGLDKTNGFYVEIDGRDYPELVDRTLCGLHQDKNAGLVLASVLYYYLPSITLTFWNGTSWSEATLVVAEGYEDSITWSPSAPTFPDSNIVMSYSNKKIWSVIKETCGRVGLDCYMDYDTSDSTWKLRTFLQGGIINTNAGMAYGVNVISISPYGKDNNEVFNRVIVNGKQEYDGVILLLATEEDTTSQADLWIKDKVLNESDITTMDGVREKAVYELSNGINVEASGKITIIGCPTLRPGDTISCSIPYCDIYGNYRVQSYTHKISKNYTTTVDLVKKTKGLQDMLVVQDNPDDFIGGVNPENMKDSYTVYFDEDPSIMTHHGTQELNGDLKLQDAYTYGTASSETLSVGYDVTQCQFKRRQANADLCTFEISNNGGVTYETYSTTGGDYTHVFSIPNRRLKFRMNLSRTSTDSVSPTFESISLIYK